MDEGIKFVLQLIVTVIGTLSTLFLVERVKARAELRRAEADGDRAGGEKSKSLSESAAILADTSADLAESWQDYAKRAQEEFKSYKDRADGMIKSLRDELEEHKRKSNEDTANQNAVIFDLTAQVATLKRENSDLRGRIVELEAENADLKRQYPKRTLGSK